MIHQRRTPDCRATARHPNRRAVLTVGIVVAATSGMAMTGMPQSALGMSVRAIAGIDAGSKAGPSRTLAPPTKADGSATGTLTGLLGTTPTTLNVLGLLPTPTTTTTTTTAPSPTTTTAPPPTTTTAPLPITTTPVHVPVKHPTTTTPVVTLPVAITPTTKPPKSTKRSISASSSTTSSTGSSTSKKKGSSSTSTSTSSSTSSTASTAANGSNRSTTTTTTAPPPPLSSIAADCSSDVSASLTAYLAALPDGSAFTSPTGACYQVDNGIVISHSLTIDGGTFKDMNDTGTGRHQNYRPIIALREADNVTLENLTVEGANTTHGFKAPRVGQAGVKIFSSSHVNITNVTATDTFGDGLEMVADFGRNWSLGGPLGTPDSDITVNGFSSLRSGRVGLTPAEVVDSTFSNIYLYQSATRSIDFESDIKGQGSGNDVFNNVVASHGINMVEALKGPITFDHTANNGRFYLTEAQNQNVTYENGSFECNRHAPGSCVNVKVGALNVINTTLGYRPGTEHITEVGYHAYPGAQVNVS
jgi:outer membrane biosynthesis protein TonB